MASVLFAIKAWLNMMCLEKYQCYQSKYLTKSN